MLDKIDCILVQPNFPSLENVIGSMLKSLMHLSTSASLLAPQDSLKDSSQYSSQDNPQESSQDNQIKDVCGASGALMLIDEMREVLMQEAVRHIRLACSSSYSDHSWADPQYDGTAQY